LRNRRQGSIIAGCAIPAERSGRNDLPHSSNDDTTRASASLPGLEIEIVHRRPRGDDVEALSINLQAMPSFEVFGRFLEAANPFAFWAQAFQLAWQPWFGTNWLEANRALMSPWSAAGAALNAPKLQPSAQPDDGKES
jgi:hypothetical protein